MLLPGTHVLVHTGINKKYQISRGMFEIDCHKITRDQENRLKIKQASNDCYPLNVLKL